MCRIWQFSWRFRQQRCQIWHVNCQNVTLGECEAVIGAGSYFLNTDEADFSEILHMPSKRLPHNPDFI